MTWARFVILLIVTLAPSLTLAGTVRYELPTLLGEHRSTGTSFSDRFAEIATPFGFYAVEQARIVMVGSVQSGRARGDGVVREATDFELKPFARPTASFVRTIEFTSVPTSSLFRFDEIYSNPFVPETTPLPNPDGYPPVTFSVGFWLGLSISTEWPAKIHPTNEPDLNLTGVIIDEPIIANVTTAYVELSGVGIVPEPTAGALVLAGCAGIGMARRRMASYNVALPPAGGRG